MNIAVVSVIAALGIGLGVQTWLLHLAHDAAASVVAEQAEADRMAERRITATHRSIEHVAVTHRQQDAAAADRAAVAGSGLRLAARATADAAAAACGGDAAQTPADLLADLPVRMDEAGRDVAIHAQALQRALDACHAAYDAARAAVSAELTP